MIKILVVDDEPGICDILKKTFSPIGFNVLVADSGREALAAVRKEKPKIVFLDIRMPQMSGLEVLRQIKEIDKTIKVIMVTVMDDEKTRNEAKKLGADEFVTKPFASDRLEEIVADEVARIIKPKILVVDDEPDTLESLSNIISRRFDCIVDKAADGREALDKLKKGAFDLAVLDVRMPGLSGIDVIKEAVKFSPKTKFLVISGYDSQAVADEALAVGATDFISKPVTQEAIEAKLRHILASMGKY